MGERKLFILIALLVVLLFCGVISSLVYWAYNQSRTPSTPIVENDPVEEPEVEEKENLPSVPVTPPKPIPQNPAPLEPTPPSTVSPVEIQYGDQSKKQVIFTFDGGSGTQSLDKILNTLDQFNLKSTFFITGKWSETSPESIKKINDAGHEIFNHTYNHPDLTTLTDQQIITELQDTEIAIKSITGKSTKPFYRPPYGGRDERVRTVAAAQGYRTVYWTIDALDWKESSGITEAEVKARVLDNVVPGAIYLMHVGDNITGNVLAELFTEVIDRGYKIVPLSEGL